MKRSTRNLYSFLSILPSVLFAIFMSFFVSMMVDIFHNMEQIDQNPQKYFPFQHMIPIIIAGIVMMLVGLTVMGIFIMHVVNNKSLADHERIVWIVVFLFAGMIGIPIYWFAKGIKYDPATYQPVISKNTM